MKHLRLLRAATTVLSLLFLVFCSCDRKSPKAFGGRSPNDANRKYVAEMLRIIEKTIDRRRLSGMNPHQITRQYFRFAEDVRSLGTVGVSEELFTSAHGWADAYAEHARAIEYAAALPGDSTAVADGIARLVLGEHPGAVYDRESRRQSQSTQAWQVVQATYDAVELRKSDVVRALHNLGFK